MATDENLRQITTDNGRIVYINVLDIRSFYNYENKLIIEMIDGTTYNVNGAPAVAAFYASTFVISPTEVTVTNNPLIIEEHPTALQYTSQGYMIQNFSVLVMPANANRKYLLLQNVSGSQEPVYFNFKTPATLGNGISIKADESFEFPIGTIYTGVVTAISATSSNKAIVITEGYS